MALSNNIHQIALILKTGTVYENSLMYNTDYDLNNSISHRVSYKSRSICNAMSPKLLWYEAMYKLNKDSSTGTCQEAHSTLHTQTI